MRTLKLLKELDEVNGTLCLGISGNSMSETTKPTCLFSGVYRLCSQQGRSRKKSTSARERLGTTTEDWRTIDTCPPQSNAN
jgi:hypothetical protein